VVAVKTVLRCTGLLFFGLLGLVLLAFALGGSLNSARLLAYYASLGDSGAIYLHDIDRALHVPMYKTSRLTVNLSWSPDGAHLAFITFEDNAYYLNIVNSDGQNARRVTDQTASTGKPSWSLDSRIIGFSVQRVMDVVQYVVDADGYHLRDLMGSGNGASTELAWSPDGARVALASWVNGSTFEIYVMDAAPCISGGSLCRPTRLTTNSADDRLPTWSPDGSKIAFLSNRSGKWEIYVVEVDCPTCRPRPLTDLSIDPGTPLSWSPDGRWVTFGVSPAIAASRIYVVDTTCSANAACTHLVSDKEKGSHQPQWSPDGQYIAYYQSDSGGTRIAVMDTACLDQPRTCVRRTRLITPPDTNALYPVWQP
jgi:TolB protein